MPESWKRLCPKQRFPLLAGILLLKARLLGSAHSERILDFSSGANMTQNLASVYERSDAEHLPSSWTRCLARSLSGFYTQSSTQQASDNVEIRDNAQRKDVRRTPSTIRLADGCIGAGLRRRWECTSPRAGVGASRVQPCQLRRLGGHGDSESARRGPAAGVRQPAGHLQIPVVVEAASCTGSRAAGKPHAGFVLAYLSPAIGCLGHESSLHDSSSLQTQGNHSLSTVGLDDFFTDLMAAPRTPAALAPVVRLAPLFC